MRARRCTGERRLRLRDEQQVAAERALAHARVQRCERAPAWRRSSGLVVEQAEPGAGDDAQRSVDELVVARAQEDEVVVEPASEELDGLRDLVLVVARGALARDGSTMWSTRSRSSGKSRTTRRTSASTERTASSRSASSSGTSRRSSSKCMTDSVAGAPLGCRMRVMPPSGARSVPTIGCSTRTIPSPRACSSALTESTRNGRSSVLVSSTEPAGS